MEHFVRLETMNLYFDNNATTPLSDSVKKVLIDTLNIFGNPSSIHKYGAEPKQIIAKSRESVAALIGAHANEIIFTSGGSESNSTALLGVVNLAKNAGGHIITSCIEHPSILEVIGFLEKSHGYRVTYLPVDELGFVSTDDVKNAISIDTKLICIMMANNEIGSIQPIEEISRLAKQFDIHLHCDAVQAVGKINVDVNDLLVDTLSISGHKFHAPKGIGALYVRKNVNLSPLIRGGGQESGVRGGTENVIFTAALGRACEIARQNIEGDIIKLSKLKKSLFHQLKSKIPDISLNGDLNSPLFSSNTLSVSIPAIRGEALVAILSEKYGIALSTGSACSTNKQVKLSHVLQAIGLDKKTIQSTVRISLNATQTETDIKFLVDKLASSVVFLRTLTTHALVLDNIA